MLWMTWNRLLMLVGVSVTSTHDAGKRLGEVWRTTFAGVVAG
jgi:hypothetical protein